MKKEVSELAVFKRVKRKLAKDGAQLYQVNPNHKDTIEKYGRYYVVTSQGVVKAKLILAEFARGIGVLKQHEEMI